MTHKEMQRRIQSMQPEDYSTVLVMIQQGYGANGIKQESSATPKQINAVFQMVEQAGGTYPIDFN